MAQSEFAAALIDLNITPPETICRYDGKSAPRRFGIYRNNVYSSLVNTLADGFPVTEQLVGQEFFKAMASVYARHNLPRSPVMVFYGEGFGAFIDDFEPVSGLPYLGDVARLEYARRLALHACDTAMLSSKELGGIPASKLLQHSITLHPSVRVVASDYPVFSIWTQSITPDNLTIPAQGEQGENVLVARLDMNVEVELLPSGGVSFVNAILEGQPLQHAAEALFEQGHGANINALIRIILQSGTHIYLKKSPTQLG